eukprot:242161_1
MSAKALLFIVISTLVLHSTAMFSQRGRRKKSNTNHQINRLNSTATASSQSQPTQLQQLEQKLELLQRELQLSQQYQHQATQLLSLTSLSHKTHTAPRYVFTITLSPDPQSQPTQLQQLEQKLELLQRELQLSQQYQHQATQLLSLTSLSHKTHTAPRYVFTITLSPDPQSQSHKLETLQSQLIQHITSSISHITKLSIFVLPQRTDPCMKYHLSIVLSQTEIIHQLSEFFDNSHAFHQVMSLLNWHRVNVSSPIVNLITNVNIHGEREVHSHHFDTDSEDDFTIINHTHASIRRLLSSPPDGLPPLESPAALPPVAWKPAKRAWTDTDMRLLHSSFASSAFSTSPSRKQSNHSNISDSIVAQFVDSILEGLVDKLRKEAISQPIISPTLARSLPPLAAAMRCIRAAQNGTRGTAHGHDYVTDSDRLISSRTLPQDPAVAGYPLADTPRRRRKRRGSDRSRTMARDVQMPPLAVPPERVNTRLSSKHPLRSMFGQNAIQHCYPYIQWLFICWVCIGICGTFAVAACLFACWSRNNASKMTDKALKLAFMLKSENRRKASRKHTVSDAASGGNGMHARNTHCMNTPKSLKLISSPSYQLVILFIATIIGILSARHLH